LVNECPSPKAPKRMTPILEAAVMRLAPKHPQVLTLASNLTLSGAV